MFIRIDPQSEEPIFAQIAYSVKGAVARGELTAGDKLPSVRELAREISVNPNTVVRAYDVLTRDGVLVRRQGAGCFVTDRANALKDEERTRQLDVALQRTVTEAFHLGFDAEAVRRALEQALKGVQFRSNGKQDDDPRQEPDTDV